MFVLATGFALLLAAAQGEVYVATGDTLVISGTVVRLHGIDVPGDNDRQVDAARRHVQELVDGKIVTCRLGQEWLSHHRLGTCFADGEDIGAALIAGGFALDCESYSRGEYRQLEPDGSRQRLQASGYCRH